MIEKTEDRKFLQIAIDLSREGMSNGDGGPFGCVIVNEGKVIGKGNNKVTSLNDPTAHAEIVAIREACLFLGTFQLTGCTIYTSCEPCPMCLGAIYWARPERVVFACSKDDAAGIGFDDAYIYAELSLPSDQRNIPFIHLPSKDAEKVFRDWMHKEDRIVY